MTRRKRIVTKTRAEMVITKGIKECPKCGCLLDVCWTEDYKNMRAGLRYRCSKQCAYEGEWLDHGEEEKD